MKKTAALFLALLMLLTLCACSGNAGGNDTADVTYTLYAMDYGDSIVLTEELFEGESYITLKNGGKAVICLEDDKNEVKWKSDGTKLTFTGADGDMDGNLSNGVLTLETEDARLYFVANDAAKAKIKAVTLEELLYGSLTQEDDSETKEDDAGTQDDAGTEDSKDPSKTKTPPSGTKTEPAGPSELQKMWNGWYYGCIDLSGCTGDWASRDGETYDAVLYVELDKDGVGKFAVFDPFDVLVSSEHSSIYAEADCHADISITIKV